MAIGTTIDASRPSLTSNDSAVLQALFDAESSPSSAVAIDAALSPFPEYLHISAETHESLRECELSIIRALQAEDVSPSTIESAIKGLDALIVEHPTYPPAYVNRAQTIRLLIEKTAQSTASTDADDAIFAPNHVESASRLLFDLGKAITLCTPRSPADPVSTVQARILADSHTHRGYLMLKAARIKKNLKEGEAMGGPDKLQELGPDQLEEMASRDFFFGGRYGNKVAQQLAVQTNPYAKMCGAIVKEALRKEVEGSV
ncbi:protein hmgX [Aspergillus clavatus NRRL 1]|uniref:Tetratricopeptide repeat protein 36 n=1 Tax=Aspergillus clavatus (strain ATCC 1007 / CBS 513.65 / DSM 816 / NCTC 3887 / NRRL 1 / QM 1276 / 107) TaxID=344612 RepID=A1CEP0_ASPCL|nr:uncharacterized protein ACLA_090320 [Aspergillus clavatus NRRL 1]EAW11339.1 conserved hypothetical protein [Aspergillus clavatus NRRL 1]